MTDLTRQSRRLDRLRNRGITRTTLLVHNDARMALEAMRPAFVDPVRATALLDAWTETISNRPPINVAQVQHISPWRYPGGKTWLIPELRSWLQALPTMNRFVEPFAGGASCGLMVANEGLAGSVVLGELDEDVSSVWEIIINGDAADVRWLCNKVVRMDVTLANVRAVLDSPPRNIRERAFKTLLQNRCARGGILAPGAGLTKTGEAGKGLKSRWYPDTLVRRIELIRSFVESLTFCQGDAFDLIRQYKNQKRTAFFIDPPYTIGSKRAGSRLYSQYNLDHEALFKVCAELKGPVLMTYPEDQAVVELADQYGFTTRKVAMKSTHHALHQELILTKV